MFVLKINKDRLYHTCMGKLYEITRIQRNNATGSRLGIVTATSKQNAIEVLKQYRALPSKVRVFPVSLVKSKGSKTRVLG